MSSAISTDNQFSLVDTIVIREGANSPWVKVEFVGSGGEIISVRMPFAVSHSAEVLQNRVIERATQLLHKVALTGGTVTAGITQKDRFTIIRTDV